MSVEPIEKVMKLWQSQQITEEQVIGKVLVWYHNLYIEHLKLQAELSKVNTRLAQLEAKPNNGETPTSAEGDF